MNKFMFFFEDHSCEREGRTLTEEVHKVESCINCQSKIYVNFINDFCKRNWKSKIVKNTKYENYSGSTVTQYNRNEELAISLLSRIFCG